MDGTRRSSQERQTSVKRRARCPDGSTTLLVLVYNGLDSYIVTGKKIYYVGRNTGNSPGQSISARAPKGDFINRTGLRKHIYSALSQRAQYVHGTQGFDQRAYREQRSLMRAAPPAHIDSRARARRAQRSEPSRCRELSKVCRQTLSMCYRHSPASSLTCPCRSSVSSHGVSRALLRT